MNDYVTYELSEDGNFKIKEVPCSQFISGIYSYVLRDKTFVSEYINKYGRYIGLLYPRDMFTFKYTDKDTINNSGIIAFL